MRLAPTGVVTSMSPLKQCCPLRRPRPFLGCPFSPGGAKRNRDSTVVDKVRQDRELTRFLRALWFLMAFRLLVASWFLSCRSASCGLPSSRRRTSALRRAHSDCIALPVTRTFPYLRLPQAQLIDLRSLRNRLHQLDGLPRRQILHFHSHLASFTGIRTRIRGQPFMDVLYMLIRRSRSSTATAVSPRCGRIVIAIDHQLMTIVAFVLFNWRRVLATFQYHTKKGILKSLSLRGIFP